MDRFTLEDKLIKLSADVITLLKDTYTSVDALHLYEQISRSSTSAALNYAEAISAESRRDFIHKLSVSLKELRETHANLKILHALVQDKGIQTLDNLLDRCDHLIAILTKSIRTLKSQ